MNFIYIKKRALAITAGVRFHEKTESAVLSENRSEAHAAGGGQGGDGDRQHGHDHLDGLALDQRPGLLFQRVKDFHSSLVFWGV